MTQILSFTHRLHFLVTWTHVLVSRIHVLVTWITVQMSTLHFLLVYHGMVSSHDIVYVLLAVAVLLLLWSVVLIRRHRSLLHIRSAEADRLRRLIMDIRRADTLENNLGVILRALSTLVRAPYYAAYVKDPKSDRFTLRAVSHPFDPFEGTGPSYSGLALPKKDAYLPPKATEDDHSTLPLQLSADGEVPVLLLRTQSGRSLIRIAPAAKLERRTKRELGAFLAEIEPLMEDLIESDAQRLRMEVAAVGDKAIKQVARLATDLNAALAIVIRSFSGVARGVGGVMIESGSGEVHGIEEDDGLAQELQKDQATARLLQGLAGDRSHVILTRSDRDFYQLPAYMARRELGAVAVIPVPGRGTLVFLYGMDFDEEAFLRDGSHQIRILAEELRNIAGYAPVQRRLSKSYARMLWQISDMVDNFSPYTVGYSGMMTRYSLALGARLGLDEEEMNDLALAAHLSNIGVLGLNSDLLTKEGKYSEFEYESMKTHSEIGASMIQISTGNQRAAEYVLYHHERIDGLGYPAGRKGGDIPLGARVLHVVQVFLAKINGRSWRTPLQFGQALEALKLAADSQLDADVVREFIQWWQVKGKEASDEGKIIAPCHELCATPEVICQSCPVYPKSHEVHCWEVGDNHCKQHGRECSTCFVRGEYYHRTRGRAHFGSNLITSSGGTL